MLHEIAITPSVFRRDGYDDPGTCEAHMQGIWEPLTERLLIRNLHGGDWHRCLVADKTAMPHQAQKLLSHLKRANRLIDAVAEDPPTPVGSADWCAEALASHARAPLTGILACKNVKSSFRAEQLVASVENRSSSEWWDANVVGVGAAGPRVRRSTAEYLNRLRTVLRYANHIMFLDPHLDPRRKQYAGFIQILERCAARIGPLPLLEIHRVSHIGSGPTREIIAPEDWRSIFTGAWDARLKAAGLRVRVVIWKGEEHERHLISNLIGLHVGNGFDVDEARDAVCTWSRLSSRDRDVIQREFDPAVRAGDVYADFSVGSQP